MKIITHTLAACLLLSALALAPAQADTDHGFSTLFIFGDSLSDPGNAFAITGETAHPPFDPIPSAAYGVGGHHFSNGRTWVEVMAQEMGLTEDAKPAFRDPAFHNFAFAGARTTTIAAPGFDTQVQVYLSIHGCAAPEDALFVVQFGGNDLRDAVQAFASGQDPAPIVGAAVTALVQNIGILAQCGAKHIMLANAPNLGAAPAIPAPFKSQVAGLSNMYNQAVLQMLNAYFPQGINFYHVDFFGFVSAASATPELFGFSDGSTPCLNFGVVEQAFCKDRDRYLFWDAIHPTKKAHQKIADVALGALNSN